MPVDAPIPFECAQDGSLVLRESRQFLRWVCFVAAFLLAVIVVLAYAVGDRSDWKLPAGGLAGTAGLVWLAAVLSDLRIVFDFANERLIWEQGNLMSTRRVLVPFFDVRDAFVLESASRDDDNPVGGYVVTYRSMLRTARETLPLSLSEGTDKADSQALCDAVLKLLGRESTAPSAQSRIEHALRAGRLIDAVSMIRADRGVDLAEARRLAEEVKAKLKDVPNAGVG